jgi:hypothetical protein
MLSGWDYAPLGRRALRDIMPGRIELRVRPTICRRSR